MDPVQILPAEIFEIVFDFLTPKDALNCFYISSSWKQTIESSRKCMEKLTLKLSGRWMANYSSDDKDKLLRTKKFSNVIIFDGSEILPFVQSIMSATHHWKSVSIYCTEFETSSEFVEFIKSFEQTVESLVLHRVNIRKYETNEMRFGFQKLKTLSLASCGTQISSAVLKDNQSLKVLTLGNFNPKTNLEVILESMKECRNLNKLCTSPKFFSILFQSQDNGLNVHLQSLDIASDMYFSDVITFRFFYLAQQNFHKFLLTQVSTLKTLNLAGIFGVEIVRLAFKMEKLEKLSIPNLSMFSWPTLNFVINNSIKNLDISTIDIRNKELVKVFFKCVPNLQTLRIQNMDKTVAKQMRRKLRRLENVSVTHFYDCSVQDILPNVLWN